MALTGVADFRGVMVLAAALAASVMTPVHAACPIELATYGEIQSGVSVEFTPTQESATVTNSFKMLLDNNVVLKGVVMWTDEVRRPRGMLSYNCPEGDVTGEELAICTVWEGIVYAVDKTGFVTPIPAAGADAPEFLLFSDLGPSLRYSSAYGASGFQKVPWDVFKVSGCQE